MFCREQISLLRRAREADPRFPEVVLVHGAEAAEGEAELARRWPAVAAIADPTHALYEAFGLGRANLLRLFGPAAWLAGLRAIGRGHGLAMPKSDPLLPSGAFLVQDGRVMHAHYSAHAGDILDPELVPRRAPSQP